MTQATQTAVVTPPPIITCPQVQNEREYKGFYKTVGGSQSKCMYPTRLDTYGCGCFYNCGYCYGRLRLEPMGNWDRNNPKIADIGKIEKKIRTLSPGSIVRLGGMTDCFQPLELEKDVTLETIKLLNKHLIQQLIVTKSPTVSYPYFLEVLDPSLAHIQITVTSLDYARSKHYEGAVSPEQRISAILSLQKKGFDVAIRLSPLIEEFMDFDKLNSLGINNCVVEFLRLNSQMITRFRLPLKSCEKYTLFEGNYRHLPLDEKLRIIDKVKIPNVSICEKVPEHYDDWKKHFNPNPDDCCNLRLTGGVSQ